MSKITKIGILLLLVVAFIGLRQTGLAEMLTFEYLMEEKEQFQDVVSNNYLISVIVFILTYVVSTAFSLPGGLILSLTGGLLFGAVLGTLYINIGATIGAFAAFLAARYLLGEWIQSKYGEKLKKFNAEIDMHGGSYLLTLRLIPIFPFFLVNLCAGLTKVRTWTYLWTTIIGIIPGSFVFAFAGQQLDTVHTVGDILSREMFLAFVLLGLFALIPVIHKKYHQHKRK